MAKIDLLEKKSLTNQAQIKELNQEEHKVLQFSLKEDIQELKRQITDFNNQKYFLNDIIAQHKEINTNLNNEVAAVKDEFQLMVALILLILITYPYSNNDSTFLLQVSEIYNDYVRLVSHEYAFNETFTRKREQYLMLYEERNTLQLLYHQSLYFQSANNKMLKKIIQSVTSNRKQIEKEIKLLG